MKKCTTTHCPRIMKKLEKNKETSYMYTTTRNGESKYQIYGPNGQFVVDKVQSTCSCRVWQLSGIPCSHVVSAINYNMERSENYLYEWHSVSIYLDTYGHTLNPTHGKEDWPKSEQGPMIPPLPVNRKKGKLY